MTKTDELLKQLTAGWCDVPVMLAFSGWKPHTLRAAISVLAKKHGLKIERQRVDGITSYRVSPPEYDKDKDFAGSLNDGYAAIRDRMAAGGPGWTPGEPK